MSLAVHDLDSMFVSNTGARERTLARAHVLEAGLVAEGDFARLDSQGETRVDVLRRLLGLLVRCGGRCHGVGREKSCKREESNVSSLLHPLV